MVWGILNFILGISILLERKLIIYIILKSFFLLNKGISLSHTKDVKFFSKWIGEIVVLEGALYIFLASASIFFKIMLVIVIVFVIFIEIIFFNIIINGINDFLE